MNDGFSFDTANRMFRIVPVSWINLGYIAGDRRQNVNTTFAQVSEQGESTCSVYLVAAGIFNPTPASGETLSFVFCFSFNNTHHHRATFDRC